MAGNTVHTCENTFSTIKQGTVKTEIEWQAEHCMDDSLRLATTNIGIDKGTIVSEKPRSQASH